MSNKKIFTFFLFVLIASGTVSLPAETDPGRNNIEQIVVTATKRSETLQEIPVAVTVTDASVIDQANIRDFIDLQTVVPSLRVDQLQATGATNFFIRGFGNGANNVGIEPSVGVFIDGVYRSRSVASLSDIPNLERIEVLRGPQSSIFGKNASAGVISVVTQAPQHEFQGMGELSYGNHNALVARGYVTGGLTDSVAGSLGVGINRRDGYVDNDFLGNEINERDRWNVRGQLLWTPSDTSELRLIIDYDSLDELCCAATNAINGPTGAIVQLLAGGNGLNPEQPLTDRVYYNFDPENDIENSGISLQADFDFDIFSLTSITALRNTEAYNNQDVDFSGADLVGLSEIDLDMDTFTQEIRLTSNDRGRTRWMLGGYYFDEDIDRDSGISFGSQFRDYADALIGAASGGALNSAVLEFGLGQAPGSFYRDGDGTRETMSMTDEALSIFGQVDFDISDRTTVSAGFNYTEDEKKASIRQINTDVFSSIDLDATAYAPFRNQLLFAGALAQGVGNALMLGRPATQAEIQAFAIDPNTAPVFTAIQGGAQAFADANDNNPAANPLAGLKALQFLPPFLNFPNAVEDGKTDDDDFSWNARLAHDLNANVNVYLSYATGFKASSMNLSRDSRPFPADLAALGSNNLLTPNLTLGSRFAGPEESEVIELGLKSRFDWGTLNLAVFDQTIEGFQSNLFSGTGFTLANAGEQSTQGIELETSWQATDALTLSFAWTWLDPKYDEFRVTGVFDENGNNVDLTGTKPAGIPENSLAIGASWTHQLADAGTLVSYVDFTHESEVHIAENVPTSMKREVNLVNGSIGYLSANGWKYSLWARNLFDDDYIGWAFPTVAQSGSFSAFPSQPRTWGLSIRKDF